MTRIKNGRLILTVSAIIGMIISAAAAIAICIATAGKNPQVFGISIFFMLIILSSFSSLYMGDYKRMKKMGKAPKAVLSLCEKEYGFLLGYIMTFILCLPILFLSIFYSFSNK